MASESKRVLVLDHGNSTISLSLFENGEITKNWRIPSEGLQTESDFEKAIGESLPIKKKDLKLSSIILSSVVLTKSPLIEKAVRSLVPCTEVNIVSLSKKTSLIKGGVGEELGQDLYANAIEARVKQPSLPTIVVDFGTALTFILTDEKGYIRGVSIAPGVRTSLRSLYEVAPRLEDAGLTPPETALGTTTEGAINSGVFYGNRGFVKEVIASMETELGKKTYRIATGGHSTLFAPFVGIFDEIDPLHTVKGMYHLFNY